MKNKSVVTGVLISISLVYAMVATAGTNPAFHDQMTINKQQMKVAKHVTSVQPTPLSAPQTSTHHK